GDGARGRPAPRPRRRGGVRRGAGAVRREAARGSDARGRDHQQLEPAHDRLPRARGELQATTMTDDELEFWYDHASTYSYPVAMRIEAQAAEAGGGGAWRPFLLGPIFETLLGYADSPFNRTPARRTYMWRDVERLCDADGLPFRLPSAMPRSSTLAARVAVVGVDEGWVARFSPAVFRANFPEARDIVDAQV